MVVIICQVKKNIYFLGLQEFFYDLFILIFVDLLYLRCDLLCDLFIFIYFDLLCDLLCDLFWFILIDFDWFIILVFADEETDKLRKRAAQAIIYYTYPGTVCQIIIIITVRI